MNAKEIVRFLVVWAICASILLGALVIAKQVEEYRVHQIIK